jgi:hypothetical protein
VTSDRDAPPCARILHGLRRPCTSRVMSRL